MTIRRLRIALPALLLAVLLLAGCATRPSAEPSATASTPGTHPVAVLVSIDGLRADRVGSGRMPTLDGLARTGAWARDGMRPSYPSLTFPNHYTLVTGLRPDHHGIVQNTMVDPALGRFTLRDRAAVSDARWWGGEPVWTTLERNGGRAATMFWPGSEAPISGRHPTDWRLFDASKTPNQRVDEVLDWVSRPAATRPGFVTLYFDQVDHEAHSDGPDSDAALAAMREVDDALARLLAGLRQRKLLDTVNLLIVSDHGMASVPAAQVLAVEDMVPPALAAAVTTGQVLGFRPRPGNEAAVEARLLGRHAHYACWRKGELPARWHYGSHPRIPPIVCQMDEGWDAIPTLRMDRRPMHTRGSHGYDPELPSMRAVFVADGPGFREGARLPVFDNVDVYPLLMHLLGLPPRPTDGDIAPLRPALRDAP